MTIPTPDEIIMRASSELFSKKLLTNVHRAVVVEAIVATAIEPDWSWCSSDYASYDFRHSSGMRLEIKQSASLQSWNADCGKESRCYFDIAERSGEQLDGLGWVERRGRNADLYALCHHPVISAAADHRDPSQWVFYLVPETKLPPQKTIGLGAVKSLSMPVTYAGLRVALEQCLVAA